MSESTLRIGVVYPTVLGTYGDTGNSVVLKKRAEARQISAEVIHIPLGDPVPEGLDIYTLGGGEDTAQAVAAAQLAKYPGLSRAAEKGAPVLAVCAALQILGKAYTDASGNRVAGLGLLDLVTEPMAKRAIGELVEEPLLSGLTQTLTGFENHGGGTTLGPSAAPLGRVISGVGNKASTGPGARYGGAVQNRVVATYMHGPVLARNPQLADLLLEWATGKTLGRFDMPVVEQMRAERITFATSN